MNFIGMKHKPSLSPVCLPTLPFGSISGGGHTEFVFFPFYNTLPPLNQPTKLLLNSPQHTNAVTLTELLFHVSLSKRTTFIFHVT